MIKLDINTYLLFNLFNISPKKLSNEYSGMSIEDIMQAEAAQGNAAAANFDMSILNDPIKLVKFLQLNDVGNKYAILSNMSEKDLEDLLPLLDPSELVMGLNFFNKDKLLQLFEGLPKDELIKYAFTLFSPEQIMKLMPEEQLDKALMSSDIDKGLEMKYLENLSPAVLAKMLEVPTGEFSAGGGAGAAGISGAATEESGQKGLNKFELLNQLASLPDDKFREALVNMPTNAKRGFMFAMAKENPKIFRLFDAHAYTKIIGDKKTKEEMIKSAIVIKPEELVKMIKKLPKDLMSIVLTQIDPTKFASALIANFKDIIKQITAG